MPEQDAPNPLEELLKKRHDAAMKVLEFFIDKYSPAENKDDADSFFSTDEISNAIASHTGVRLEGAEIFELMVNMGYKFEELNGLEFNWLLKKDNQNGNA